MSPLLLKNTSTPAKPAGQVYAEVDASRARKRKKVKMSLNSKFADIKAIRRAQIEAGELESSTDESSESENPSDSESCIVVAS
ncbi:transposase [Colletotrichum kahawae]|uniref:Transposase n=1 Tax=Colletotrichum kahawae TaxID=34407 RepID=A0AAE0D6V2_COLKA|nr:transposase [Colletotrichum kahawae]